MPNGRRASVYRSLFIGVYLYSRFIHLPAGRQGPGFLFLSLQRWGQASSPGLLCIQRHHGYGNLHYRRRAKCRFFFNRSSFKLNLFFFSHSLPSDMLHNSYN